MKYKHIFEKAYSRLMELYSGECSEPDITILNRFYQEKIFHFH